jgi:hypothetical protein
MRLRWAALGLVGILATAAAGLAMAFHGLDDELQARRRVERELAERRKRPEQAAWVGRYELAGEWLHTLELHADGRYGESFLAPAANCIYDMDGSTGTWFVEDEQLRLWRAGADSDERLTLERSATELVLRGPDRVWRRRLWP